MEGIIVNYRRGRKTQTTNQMIILVKEVESKESAGKLVGKTVTYVCDGKLKKEISGKVSAVHGSKGAVRVHFEKGMPGQAIGGKVSFK